jgi:hypothetical protein
VFRTAVLPRGMIAAARTPLLVFAALVCLAIAVAISTRARVERTNSFAFDTTAMSPPAAAPAPEEADFAGRGVALGGQIGRQRSQSVQVTSTASGAPLQMPTAPDAMIIRNGHVVVEVDSLELAIERARQVALSLGGSIGNVSMHTGEHQVRGASVELKVPAARFDDAMTGLSPLGEVEQSNTTAQDVGEEYVDITARVANAKRLEERLINLLATRTGRLEDVLAVERELARVREEIERYEGRLRFLSTRVATSTIVASLHEEAPLVAATPGTNVIGQAFRDMWRNFVRFIATMIESLGLLIPLAALLWLAWRAMRRWRTPVHSDAPVAAHLRDTPA